MKMKTNTLLVVSNYNADISWITDYTENYLIYDRSDSSIWTSAFDQSKVIRVPNVGWDIYDKLTYIIDNYDSLPDTMILTKGNIFKYISRHEFDAVCNNISFTPLHSQFHRPKLPVAYYGEHGLYYERNDSWYLKSFPAKFFKSFNEFIRPYVSVLPLYIPFAPGSNYLVTRKDVIRYPKAFYETLRTYVDYSPHPGEAQIIERALLLMWNGTLVLDNPHPAPTRIDFQLLGGNAIQLAKDFVPKGIKKSVRQLIQKVRTKIHNIAVPKKGISFDEKRTEITEYRKKICIYDIFTFFNELDMLEIRLAILDPFVDYFVIVESTETFSGIPKPLYYEENKGRFRKWEHKIIHYVVRDTPKDTDDLRGRLHYNTDIVDRQIIEDALTSDNVPEGQIHWLKEFYQKESIKKTLFGLQDTDICYIGDVDEIWNPETVIDYRRNDIFKLKQNVYAYRMNNRSSEPWAGTLVTKYINVKRNCLNHLRTKSKTQYTYVENGGWHFTNMGGAGQIRKKLESYGHQEFNNDDIKSSIEDRILKNEDFIGRKFKFWTNESELPCYVLENKERYKNFFE